MVLLAGAAPARAAGVIYWVPVVTRVTAQDVERIKWEAGFLKEPMLSGELREAVWFSLLSENDLIDADLEYYRWQGELTGSDGRIYNLSAVFQAEKARPKEKPAPDDDEDPFRKKVKRAILKIAAAGAGKIALCVLTYGIQSAREACQYPASFLKDQALVDGVDRFYGLANEELVFKLNQIWALTGGAFTDYTLLALDEGGDDLGAYTAGAWRRTPMDAVAYIDPIAGRMVVPLRALGEAGLAITWDGPTRSVRLERPRDHLAMTYGIGQQSATVSNGDTKHLDPAPFIKNDRTMVPLRASLEPFCRVEWQPHHRRVLIGCNT